MVERKDRVSAYVDAGRRRLGRMKMAHLLADSEEELHRFAASIGCRREWFQPATTRQPPHYDVPAFRRERALRLGAVSLDRRGVVEFVCRWRAISCRHPAAD